MNRHALSAIALALLLASAPGPGRESAAPDVEILAPAPEAVRAALERALAAPADRHSLRLAVECRRDERMPSAVVFGRGFGIWDGRRQFALEPEAIAALVTTLRDGGFAELAATYGGRRKAEGSPAPDARHDHAALQIVCRIQLELGALSKQVVQLDEGEQSATLRQLADALYARLEPAARSGVEAVDLEDGLAKLARGVLEPETLTATLHRKPELADARGARESFLLHLEGRRARAQSFTTGEGYGETVELELGKGELAELARALAAQRPGTLPGNLWAPDYNDLVLAVLDRRVSIQARRFTGMTPATHGEAQHRFDALAEQLTRLARLVARDGNVAAPD